MLACWLPVERSNRCCLLRLGEAVPPSGTFGEAFGARHKGMSGEERGKAQLICAAEESMVYRFNKLIRRVEQLTFVP